MIQHLYEKTNPITVYPGITSHAGTNIPLLQAYKRCIRQKPQATKGISGTN